MADESATEITGGADVPDRGDVETPHEDEFEEMSNDEKHEHHHKRLNEHDEMHASHHERLSRMEKAMGLERDEGEEEEGERLHDRRKRSQTLAQRKRH